MHKQHGQRTQSWHFGNQDERTGTVLGQGDDDLDVGEEVEEREEREAGGEEDRERAVHADQRKRHPCAQEWILSTMLEQHYAR